MKKVSLFLICSIFLSQLLAQGIIFNPTKYNSIPTYIPPSPLGFSNKELPDKISYRKFCPPIADQGEFSTCVGWAVAYSQLTTQQQIMMNETTPLMSQIRSMDPYFLYTLCKNINDENYTQGIFMGDALDQLLKYGTKPLISEPRISVDYSKKLTEETFALSKNYSIQHFEAFNDTVDLVNKLKLALFNKQPIGIGLYLSNSFFSENGIVFGIWKPSGKELQDSLNFINGHAMCIIGYDDSRDGGSFELMNSYGVNFGDSGFVWIRYTDLAHFFGEAYVITLRQGDKGFRDSPCSYGDCFNLYSRYKYSNGEIYEGYFTKGFRDKYGILIDKKGNLYIGGFSNGYRHGIGIYYDAKKKLKYTTNYDMGRKRTFSKSQGFASSDENNQLGSMIDALNAIIPGEIIDFNSSNYDEFMDEYPDETEVIKAE
jgi:hypothetical protein